MISFSGPNSIGDFSGYHVNTRNGKNGTGALSTLEKDALTGKAPKSVDSYEPGMKTANVAGTYSPVNAVPLAEEAQGTSLVSSEGKMAGANNTGLRRYLNYGMGSGNTSLAALNTSRKNLGNRIASAIEAAGITLGSSEKITFSVDGKGNFVVGGLKDKNKSKAIQAALNEDKKLANDLRKHVAAQKINQYEKTQAKYEDAAKTDGDDNYTNRAMRAFIIDDYLQDKVGVSLTDLSVTKGADGGVSISGGNSEFYELLGEDPTLTETIANILENGESPSEFSASFEYANGALSDSTTLDLATQKLDSVKTRLMGGFDKDTGNYINGTLNDFLNTIVENGGTDGLDKTFLDLLGGNFKIQVSSGGTFEIVGLEELDIDSHYKDTIKGLVQKALDDWANAQPEDGGNYGVGKREASFADVTETYIEQHRFEDDDVDEFKHMLEIDLTSSSYAEGYKVVSPDADAAQDAKNQENADELGEALRTMLEEEGVDTAGLEMDIDENGKITVHGDAGDPNVRKAQTLIDAFVSEAKGLAQGAKGAGAKKEEDSEDTQSASEAFAEAQSIREGNAYEGRHAGASGMGSVVDTGKTYANEIEEALATGSGERVGRLVFLFPKFETGTHNGSTLNRVSNITPAWQSFAGAAGGVSVGGALEGKAGVSDAQKLYLKYMSGMGQFHDGNQRRSYKMSA